MATATWGLQSDTRTGEPRGSPLPSCHHEHHHTCSCHHLHYHNHFLRAGSKAPDAIFRLAIFGPATLAISTCSDKTSFDTSLLLYDGFPTEANLLAKSGDELVGDPGFGHPKTCSVLFHQVNAATTVYLVVDGRTEFDEGLFEVSIICEDLSGPEVTDACGHSMVTCGDQVAGTNIGYPSFIGTDAGDSIYVVTMFESARVTLSTCDSQTGFATQVWLYDGAPTQNGTLLAASDLDQSCGAVTYDIPAAGAYYAVVSGAGGAVDEGIFTLHVVCSGLDTTTVEESCAQQFLTCGDVVAGTTQNYHDMVGGPSPDALYVLVAFDATRIAITTCNEMTSFDTVLMVFDGAPSHENSTLLAESDWSQVCGSVFFDAPAAGSYYVVVTGKRDEEAGLFQLTIACEDYPSAPQDESCGLQFLTCGDSKIGTNVGYADWTGSKSPDAMYVHILKLSFSITRTWPSTLLL